MVLGGHRSYITYVYFDVYADEKVVEFNVIYVYAVMRRVAIKHLTIIRTIACLRFTVWSDAIEFQPYVAITR